MCNTQSYITPLQKNMYYSEDFSKGFPTVVLMRGHGGIAPATEKF